MRGYNLEKPMSKIRYFAFSLLLILFVIPACKEFNTDVNGKQFKPYNSFVTKFRQLVYVEYKDGYAEVWGPCADRVDVLVDEASHVTIKSDLDSLVVVAYGFAAHDTIFDEKDKTKMKEVVDYHGALSIVSAKPFALYLTGLKMNSDSKTAVSCEGQGDCFLVLTDKANNLINGAFEFNGHLFFDGKGSLTVTTDSIDALVAKNGLTCSYPVSVNLRSQNGRGLFVAGKELKIADGKWNIQSGSNAILSTEMSVTINGGTCYGVGAKKSENVFTGNQFTWQARVDSIPFQKDSIYSVGRMGGQDTKATEMFKLKSLYDQAKPWVLISNDKLKDGDMVTFNKNKK